jgi:phosphoribosylaminoimidazole-succinocarboxamide synthase
MRRASRAAAHHLFHSKDSDIVTATLTQTAFTGLERLSSGKVRDIYAFKDNLLLVATDRISAFDVVFPDGIPNKGAVLTQLAAFWFERTRQIVVNHTITARFDEFPEPLRAIEDLRGRATLCRRARVMPIECVVRGYLEGSGWKEYQAAGAIAGIALPPGLQRRSRLPEPIFTPATKAETGHDENITFDRMVEIVGAESAERARAISLRLYNFAAEHLASRGVLLADTKFEFGFIDGEMILIDEALTPDSSRFWIEGALTSKGEPISFDKQYVRDFLETTDWNKTPPAPRLPEEVIEQTARRYLEIFEKITGAPLNVRSGAMDRAS